MGAALIGALGEVVFGDELEQETMKRRLRASIAKNEFRISFTFSRVELGLSRMKSAGFLTGLRTL